MYKIVDYKNGKLGVQDFVDNAIEYYPLRDLVRFVRGYDLYNDFEVSSSNFLRSMECVYSSLMSVHFDYKSFTNFQVSFVGSLLGLATSGSSWIVDSFTCHYNSNLDSYSVQLMFYPMFREYNIKVKFNIRRSVTFLSDISVSDIDAGSIEIKIDNQFLIQVLLESMHKGFNDFNIKSSKGDFSYDNFMGVLRKSYNRLSLKLISKCGIYADL